jgi:hypothetical protein
MVNGLSPCSNKARRTVYEKIDFNCNKQATREELIAYLKESNGGKSSFQISAASHTMITTQELYADIKMKTKIRSIDKIIAPIYSKKVINLQTRSPRLLQTDFNGGGVAWVNISMEEIADAMLAGKQFLTPRQARKFMSVPKS